MSNKEKNPAHFDVDEVRRQGLALGAIPEALEAALAEASKWASLASSPKEGGATSALTASVTVEYSDGNPAVMLGVYLQSHVGRPVRVTYDRWVEGSNPQRNTVVLGAGQRAWIGWSCNTVPASNLCSRYIETNIVDVS